jgi:hypothetical protein
VYYYRLEECLLAYLVEALMNILDAVIVWLKDSRNWKKTFDAQFKEYSGKDREQAISVYEMLKLNDYISRSYFIEDSFVAYTKTDYDVLKSFVIEWLDKSN